MWRSPRYHPGPQRRGATAGTRKYIFAVYRLLTCGRILGTPSNRNQRPGLIGPARNDGVASAAAREKVLLFPPLQPRNLSPSKMPRSIVVCCSRPVYENSTVSRATPLGTVNETCLYV